MLPLIDIVFLLLVFFIYAMLSMSVHRSMPVKLPSSRSVEIDTSEAITVTLKDFKGNLAIFVDDKEISLDLLSTELQQRSEKQNKEKSKVQVYGDKSVSYQNLFQVLDRIKSTGIRDISLAAEEQPDTK